MRFQVLNESGSARRGLISFVKKVKETKESSQDFLVLTQTPTCVVYTKRGSVPHLTAQITSEIIGQFITSENNHLPFYLSSEYLLGEIEPAIFQSSTNLEDFLQIKSGWFFTSFNDPLRYSVSSSLEEGNTSKTVSINTWNGRRKVDSEHFTRVMNLIEPQVICAMADIIPSGESNKRVKKSVDRSLDFLDTLVEKNSGLSSIFGVVVGSNSDEERKRSAVETSRRKVNGFVIDPMNGENQEDFQVYLSTTLENLDTKQKPCAVLRTMGPEEILQTISRGVDVFDTSYIHLCADQGEALVFNFDTHVQNSLKMNLWDEMYRKDPLPIKEGCKCYACSNHSRAYISHLLHTKELLAPVLLTIHNLFHYLKFFEKIRATLSNSTFESFKDNFIGSLK